VLIDVTGILDEIIDREVSLEILALYYLSYFPIILVQSSSMACLIATLFTFSRLNNHNEIIVMRSSGLNFWQITRPALMFGILISVMIFWVNENYVPQANAKAKKIWDANMMLESDRKKMKNEIKNLTFYGLQNRLYFINSFDPQENTLNGITIIEYDEAQNIKQKIVALKGAWTGLAWKFFQCQVTNYKDADTASPLRIVIYEEKLMDIKETPEDFMKQRIDVQAMNIRELKKYIERFSNSGATKAINNLKVDIHQKIAYPFGNFIIVLVGLPFALMVKSRKRSSLTSLGIAIAIGFLFYVANAVALAFGKSGLLPPVLSAWIAPIIFTGLAIILIENNF
jgi:lipopolysaccharide export system permease protein